MSALTLAAPLLVCPRCGAGMTLDTRTLRCEAGHSTDLARQGHVNFLSRPAGAAADDAAMVAARVEVLASGIYSPIRDAVAAAVSAPGLPDGAVVDIGAGTGWYTAGALDACPGRVGIAVDLSAYAARRAAKAHPRLASIVADAWSGIPVRSGAAAVVLDVFAPRNAAEFARILAPGGIVVVVTPAPDHLTELVTRLGLPRVDPRKAERLAETFAHFDAGPTTSVRAGVTLSGRLAAQLATMGPGAHHAHRAETHALATRSEVDVTVAVDVTTFVRRPDTAATA